MIRRASTIAVVLLLAACQSPDVGQRCAFGVAGVTPQTAQGDYFENGNTECDSLICIVSPTTQAPYDQCEGTNPARCGYCSKPCVSNQDCFSSKTGLECRQMVLDQSYIAWLRSQPNGDALVNKYLGDISQYSSYCAVPLPP